MPTGQALSKARARSGEHVARRAFELDAARTDAELGIGQLWHGMEVTAIDGTTAALDANDELDAAFGVPAGGKNPVLRLVAVVRTATRRWAAAAAGGYHDGENTWLTSWNPRWPRAPQPRRPRLLLYGRFCGSRHGADCAGESRTARNPSPSRR